MSVCVCVCVCVCERERECVCVCVVLVLEKGLANRTTQSRSQHIYLCQATKEREEKRRKDLKQS